MIFAHININLHIMMQCCPWPWLTTYLHATQIWILSQFRQVKIVLHILFVQHIEQPRNNNFQ